jgi:hypothetical protein
MDWVHLPLPAVPAHSMHYDHVPHQGGALQNRDRGGYERKWAKRPNRVFGASYSSRSVEKESSCLMP